MQDWGSIDITLFFAVWAEKLVLHCLIGHNCMVSFIVKSCSTGRVALVVVRLCAAAQSLLDGRRAGWPP